MSKMLLTKAQKWDFDEADKDCPVYVLGSAPDISDLPLTFWEEHDIIGVNSTYKAPHARDNLDHWICCDAVTPFLDWVKDDKSIHKWIYYHYRIDPRLGPYIENAVLYKCIQEPPLNRDWRNGLFAGSYTIVAALSLAYALGYKDVRMRGVRFAPGVGGQNYWDQGQADFLSPRHVEAMESLYGTQLKLVKEIVVPEFKRLGLKLTNETPGAPPLE